MQLRWMTDHFFFLACLSLFSSSCKVVVRVMSGLPGGKTGPEGQQTKRTFRQPALWSTATPFAKHCPIFDGVRKFERSGTSKALDCVGIRKPIR
ncbi:MAG TPA: hypothetical protein VKO85_09880 [Wenzhouxiangellaceae bacterium]|nr:hypothetical protein [Wenzhouxiangellaceae bacterium]